MWRVAGNTDKMEKQKEELALAKAQISELKVKNDSLAKLLEASQVSNALAVSEAVSKTKATEAERAAEEFKRGQENAFKMLTQMKGLLP